MAFKITWKILMLAAFLVASIVSIINTSFEYKLLVLFFFSIFAVSFIFKSKALHIVTTLLLVFSFILIIYSSSELQGIEITSVELNSTAFENNLRKGDIILMIDYKEINNIQDYSSIILEKFSDNESKRISITTDKSEIILFTNTPPEITVSERSRFNLETGLDLSGGSRALIKAEDKELSSSDAQDLVNVLENRLNIYGISDIKIRPVSDLSGENYVLIEIAGATPKDLETLIGQQGKFEAKIGNQTVFIGGEDIASVGRSAQESRIESCRQAEGGYFCRFSFTIYLSQAAAERHAKITEALSINESNPQYLNETLDLYLDDIKVDTLLIGEGLKGRVTTQIMISGSGSGSDREQAYKDSVEKMNHLQTILITGSLPFKLEIVKLDTISPTLGKDFINSILIAGIIVLLTVSIIIFLRYRSIKSSLALLITSFSEALIILGIASFINWNLDLPSIAGILVVIGTGIDQQIIIIDESKSAISMSIKQKLKRAFAIIVGAYFTAVVAMFPLLWAGAGLLKGFALTTIIGITAGVLITRPAFTDMVKMIEE